MALGFAFNFRIDGDEALANAVTSSTFAGAPASAPGGSLELIDPDDATLDAKLLSVGSLVSVQGFGGELQRVVLRCDAAAAGGVAADAVVVRDAYEGGATVWECTNDLLRLLQRAPATVAGRSVLDLGCGVGLLGSYALRLGAAAATFQDLNAGVLRELTALTVRANVRSGARVALVAGPWDALLGAYVSGRLTPVDMVLSSETLYRPEHYATLIALVRAALAPARGAAALFATKRFYYGATLGGGTHQFVSECHAAGLPARVVTSHDDGASMVRDIVRVTLPGEDDGDGKDMANAPARATTLYAASALTVEGDRAAGYVEAAGDVSRA